tara:strand:+ start:159 stop:1010 length:852 start_codon:yes stop_codon:yes gene_type:complete
MINPFKAKKGLGRGLSSLIGDADSKPIKNKLSISSIVRNKFQPRKHFHKEKMEELTNSIRERGILQPIVVRKSSDQSGKFEIIAGERRWQAAQSAGLHEVPVVEIEADDLKSLEFAIVENVQRSDLNSIEEAKGYKKLIDEFDYDQDKVSKFIGKSRGHVANSLRLLTLPNEVILLIEENKISPGHAKVLVGLDNAFFLAKKIIEKKLSVRQAESLIRVLKNNKTKKLINKNPNLTSLEKSIEDKTGIKVLIRNKKNNTGAVTFEYKDLDQLNRLIMVIKGNY